MLEAHQGIPALGAVLNAINTRLDARTIAYILAHGEAKVLITDREFSSTVREALSRLDPKPLVVDLDDPLYEGPGERLGEIEYEELLGQGSPDFIAPPIRDEWQPIALNYTSGTTGHPKGVVFHHRGTWVMTVGQILSWHLPPRAVYLWTLPIFHANGWCFPWAVTAMAGTHVCLRRVDPALIFRLIAEHRVTNMVGAPRGSGRGALRDRNASQGYRHRQGTTGGMPSSRAWLCIADLFSSRRRGCSRSRRRGCRTARRSRSTVSVSAAGWRPSVPGRAGVRDASARTTVSRRHTSYRAEARWARAQAGSRGRRWR
jgi:acyl-CoA synthetase (AMP-forming)/AMP-acid ligase II